MVRPGYKQTEVGVIPEDWEVRRLAEHFSIYAGGDVPKHSLSAERSDSHPFPIFANALTDQGLYGFTAERRSKADSVTITGRGFIGHAEYRSEPFFPIIRLLVLEPRGELDSLFTCYAVNQCVEFANESTGVPQLTAPQVSKYSVASPPLPEQHAIAAALSDVDAALAGVLGVIAKKQDLKQAAMQTLLTGQTRLPGFSGDWEVKRLGEFIKFQVGCPFSSQFFNKKAIGIRLVRNRDLKSDDDVVFYSGAYASEFLVNDDDVLVSMDGEFVLAKWNSETAVLNQRVGKIVPRYNISADFLFYYLAGPLKEIEDATSSTTVKHLSHSDVEDISIPLPAATEQTAIAAVLSDMDAEIAALSAQADKMRLLKQAMMQDLLTGRVRLPV